MGAFDEFLGAIDNLSQKQLSDQELRDAIERYCLIRPKKGHSLVPLKFNATQSAFWPKRTNKSYVLKARQTGQSTLTLAELFMRCVLIPNESALVVAHRIESAVALFRIVHTFYKNLPTNLKEKLNGGRKTPTIGNKKELYFEGINSRISVETAQNPDAARGLTLTACSLDEYAFWGDNTEDAFSAIQAALVPDGICRVVTTPDLASSYAFTLWQLSVNGESPFAPYFLPWWDDPQYASDPAVPTEQWSEEETSLALRHGLDGRQIAWRRQMIKSQRGLFGREFPESDMDCWLHSGSTVFSIEKVLECWAKDVPDPVTASFDSMQPGQRWLLETTEIEDRLKSGHKFVIGADPAEGVPDGDFSAIQILDRYDGMQVFAGHVRIPKYQFASLLENLGITLGKALLCVERNNHGHAVLQRLEMDLHYPNIFFGDDDKPGINVLERDKALLITDLEKGFWEGAITLRDAATFSHLRSYVYDDRMKPGASEGAHDDLVSALLVAYRGLIRTGGRISYQAVGYPKLGKEREAPPGMSIGGNAGAWFKSGSGGLAGMMPYTPDLVAPELPEYNRVKTPWQCDCGSKEIAITGYDQVTRRPILTCARCHKPAGVSSQALVRRWV